MHAILVAITLALCAAFAGAQAQTFPSRTITLIVPFPPGGSTDTVARIMAERMRPVLGQPVIIENVGGAGGSTAVGRVARAEPDGYTIDIGQWDTHVGSIIYQAELRSAEGLRADRAHLRQSAADGRQERLGGERPEGACRLDEGEPRQGAVRQPERGGAGDRHPAAAGDRHAGSVRSLSRRRPGDDRSALGAGRPAGGAGRRRAAAGAGRHDQGDRQPFAAPLAGHARHPDLGRERRAGTLHVGLVRILCARKGTPKDVIAKLNGAMVQALADPAIRARFTQLGLDVASREQQTPEGLAAFHKTRDREMVADHQVGRPMAE